MQLSVKRMQASKRASTRTRTRIFRWFRHAWTSRCVYLSCISTCNPFYPQIHPLCFPIASRWCACSRFCMLFFWSSIPKGAIIPLWWYFDDVYTFTFLTMSTLLVSKHTWEMVLLWRVMAHFPFIFTYNSFPPFRSFVLSFPLFFVQYLISYYNLSSFVRAAQIQQ